MSHPFIHAQNSARIFGGDAADYQHIHNWFDETKAWCPDWRHRAIRHHEEGILECMSIFGETLTNSAGQTISMLRIGQQHLIEDLGFLATARDWMEHFDAFSWEAFKEAKTRNRKEAVRAMEDKVPSRLLHSILSTEGAI